jgi:hypothetical protein
LSTHIRRDLPSGFFPTNIICIPLPPHSWYMPCLSHPPWPHHSNYVWTGYKLWSSSLYSCLYTYINHILKTLACIADESWSCKTSTFVPNTTFFLI